MMIIIIIIILIILILIIIFVKEMIEKMFTYSIKDRNEKSCLNMGSLRVEGDLLAHQVKTRILKIRQNMKSEKEMKVEKVIAKGGKWNQLTTDLIESVENSL